MVSARDVEEKEDVVSLVNLPTHPDFMSWQASDFKPCLEHHIQQVHESIAALKTTDMEELDWDAWMLPWIEADHRLMQAWSLISHRQSVCHDPAEQDAFEAAMTLMTQHQTAVSHDVDLFRCIETLLLKFGSDLDTAQLAFLQHMQRDFRLAGVHLPEPDRQRLAELFEQEHQLEHRFETQLLEATKRWQYHVPDLASLDGMPRRALTLAIQKAEAEGYASGALLTLEPSTVAAVLEHVIDSEIRRIVYDAYVTRASEVGPHAGEFDNGPIMVDLLSVRRDIAALVGYATPAHLALVPRMAQDVGEVERFLTALSERVLPMAERDWEALSAFAEQELGMSRLEPWDVSFVSARYQKHVCDIDQESLRPYFPLERVMQGFETLLDKLYGLSLKPQEVPGWHDDVRCYAVYHGEKLLGYAYTDYFSRSDQKRGGAWISEGRSRARLSHGQVDLPMVWVHANFQPACDGQALLTHDDVLTLCHEWGHALHHVMTRVDLPAVAGLNGVPWDAVELPSQLMELWCWEPEVLKTLSAHVDSGEPLSDELIGRLQQSRHHQAGMALLRQIMYARFDWSLHTLGHDVELSTHWIQAQIDDVRRVLSVVPTAPYQRFQHSFVHIFAGGYAAGYYSYLWAEVLASDVYARFEEEGLFNATVAQDFWDHVLAQGGTVDMMAAFMAFRGRLPSQEPLLRHRGLA